VWSVLYIVIAISIGKVFFMVWEKQLSWIVALPFLLNILFNFAFIPLQFGLKNNSFAAIDIVLVLVLVTIIWVIYATYPHIKWVAYAQVPYLLWVPFVTV